MAHESWLRATPAPAKVGQPVTLGFTSGTAFPIPEAGPKPDRVGVVTARIEAAVQSVEVAGPAPGALNLTLTSDRKGLAVVAVTLNPNPITLDAAEVAEYLAEANPDAEVRAAWDALGPGAEWRELYVKNAKTLVCVEVCAMGRTAMKPSGQDLEFVALDPGAAPRRFRLVGRGQPMVGMTVQVFVPGQPTRRLKTNAGGVVTLPPTVTGEAMLSAIWLRAPTPATEGRFTSDFASIVVGALPR